MTIRQRIWPAAILAGLLAAAGCRSTGPLEVSLSLPGVSPFPPGAFRTILITGFSEDAPAEGFAAGPALEAAIETGLGSGTRDRVERIARANVEAVAGRDDPSIWKTAGAAEGPGTVYIAGSVKMSSQVRKALDRNVVADGPFDLKGRLLAKCRWRLDVDLYVISAATGETLHHQTCREQEDYGELDKTAEFAFSVLSERVVDKLKEVLLASPTIEIRTLLRR